MVIISFFFCQWRYHNHENNLCSEYGSTILIKDIRQFESFSHKPIITIEITFFSTITTIDGLS